MAVQSDTSRLQYTGNNSTEDAYPVSPEIDYFDEGDLKVVVTDAAGVDTTLAVDMDFTVTPAGVVTAAAVPGTSKVTIYRELGATQPTSYIEGDSFPAETHERALDRLTMLVQQALRKIAGAFRFRTSDGDAGEAQKVANSVFGLSAGGAPVFRTADELKAFLSLTAPILNYPTKVWEDDAERSVAVPDFAGQAGVQKDTNAVYVSTGTGAGAWQAFPGPGTVTTAMLANGALSADVAGRVKMADGFLTLAKIATGIFTADTDGRAPFASGFVNDALLAAALDLSAKTLTMPANHWRDIAPAGAVLQTLSTINSAKSSNASGSGGNGIPIDNTAPQNTEGIQLFSQAITPSSSSNKILAKASINLAVDASQRNGTVALFANAGADAIFAALQTFPASNGGTVSVEFLHAPATTSAVTYSLRFGLDAAVGGGTFYVNRFVTADLYGAASVSSFTLQEIKG